MNNLPKEYAVVRVVRLIQPNRSYTGTNGVVRAPQLLDEGTVVFVYDATHFAVECVAPGGGTLWLADFIADELELVSKL